MNQWEKGAAVKKLTMRQRIAYYSFADPVSGCWTWFGSKMKPSLANPRTLPYGRIRYNNKVYLAHRFSWIVYRGGLASGDAICHRCDNPLFVNPDHLFRGTQKENIEDRDSKERQARGEKHGFARLTDDLVRRIRASDKTNVWWEKETGIHRATIRHARARMTWKHIA